MAAKYISFLICFHENHTDIFQDGLPLGVICDGQFNGFAYILSDGSKRFVPLPGELLYRVTEALTLLQQAAWDERFTRLRAEAESSEIEYRKIKTNDKN